MSFNFPPKAWALCNGQIMSIQQNAALFALLGTTYGGNGTSTFALPNLQGQVPMHFGGAFVQGQASGEYNHSLTVNEMPAHLHNVMASNGAADQHPTGRVPGNNFLAQAAAAPAPGTPVNMYGTGGPDTNQTFAPQAIANGGGSQPHSNQQPYLTVSFCIALAGIFPSRN
jgi:microcystin-dependent protein